jgi:hypothetical protein
MEFESDPPLTKRDEGNSNEDDLRPEYELADLKGGVRGRYLQRYRQGTNMSVEELQTAVSDLPADELVQFSQWFEEYLAERWDRKIEADILAGRLDAAGRKADEDFAAGRCTRLP